MGIVHKGRLLRGLVAAALLGLVSLAAAASWSRFAGRPTADRAAESFAALSQCLLGRAGVANADKALRAIAIAADLDPQHSGWPARCAPYSASLRRQVVALHERAFRRHGKDGCGEKTECALLGRLRAELPGLRAFIAGRDEPPLDLNLVFGLSKKLGYAKPGRLAADVAAPPRPAALLDPARMTPLFSGDYLRLLTDPGGAGRVLMAFYEHESRYALCGVGLNVAKASCRQLPASLPVGMAGELLAARPGAPTLMFAHGLVDGAWSQGLYEVSSGRRLLQVASRPAGALVWPNGTFSRVSREPPLVERALYRVADGVVQRPVLIGAHKPTMGPLMVWDEVIWTESTKDGTHEVFARRAQPKGAALGSVRRLGKTVHIRGAPVFDSCRTSEALIVLLRAANGSRATLLFRTKQGWASPLQVKTGRSFGFTCQHDTATLSRISGREELGNDPFEADQVAQEAKPVTGRYTVGRMRCKRSGCEIRRATLTLTRYSRSSRYLAGDLGEAMVVMWRSPMGDVRMRVAPLDDLSGTPDVPVFDDIEHEGFGWDLERDPIIGRGGKVIVLISRQLGTSADSSTYAFRIDDEGRVSPVTVAADHSSTVR